jgi:hypothetical protein
MSCSGKRRARTLRAPPRTVLSPNVEELVESEDFEDLQRLPARRDDDQASSDAGEPSVQMQERLGARGVHKGHAADVEMKFAALPVQCPGNRVFEGGRTADIEFADHVESFFRAVPGELESQDVIGHLGSGVRPSCALSSHTNAANPSEGCTSTNGSDQLEV